LNVNDSNEAVAFAALLGALSRLMSTLVKFGVSNNKLGFPGSGR